MAFVLLCIHDLPHDSQQRQWRTARSGGIWSLTLILSIDEMLTRSVK